MSAAQFPDDTDVWSDLTEEATESIPGLRPVAPNPRPSGLTHIPRLIGLNQDIAFMHSAREHHEHVLFIGPPGTGKTSLAEAAFTQYESLVCTADTTEADFVGGFIQDPNTGGFTWLDGPLLRAAKQGIPLYVDEIAQADPRVLVTLYAPMDGRTEITVPANPSLAPVHIEEGFFVIGAANLDVPGAVLSEALRDRFTHHIVVGTDWDLAKTLHVPATIIKVAQRLDQKRLEMLISWSPQLRSLCSFRDIRSRYGEEFALQDLIAKAPVDDRDVIAEEIERAFPGQGLDDRSQPRVLRMGRQFR